MRAITVLLVVVLAGVGEECRADFITGVATVLADNPTNGGTVGDVEDVVQIQLQGSNNRAYTNTIGFYDTGNVDGGGNPIFLPIVRAVGTSLIQAYQLDPNGSFNPIHFDGEHSQVISVFAIEGIVTSFDPGGLSTALFTSGVTALFQIPDDRMNMGQDPDDPATWNAITLDAMGGGGTLNPYIARYSLKPQEDVYDGVVGGLPLLKAADLVNVSSVNLGSGQANGNLLFKEDPASDFLTLTFPSAPPGTVIDAEGFWMQYRQSLNKPAGAGVDATDLVYFNLIAELLGGYGDLGGAHTAFATGIAANLTDAQTDPTTFFASNDGNLVNDIATSFDTQAQNIRGLLPGIEVTQVESPVPEPTSLVLFGTGALGLGFGARRRKRRSEQQAAA